MSSTQRCATYSVPALRRAAHEFLRRYAAAAWLHEHDGHRWQINLPPELDQLPERKRYRTHARREANRLAEAHLYDLCPQATHQVVFSGADLREQRHDLAVALAGRGNVIDTLEIQPPARTGFVRWQDGISFNERGAPILACHWGPADHGIWLVWWCDNYTLTRSYAHEARADNGPAEMTLGLLPTVGPLWYDHQALLRPHARTPEPAVQPAQQEEIDACTVALLYTTVATWSLLSCPPATVSVTQQPPSPDQQRKDRDAGLQPRPVTVATAQQR